MVDCLQYTISIWCRCTHTIYIYIYNEKSLNLLMSKVSNTQVLLTNAVRDAGKYSLSHLIKRLKFEYVLYILYII